MLTKPTISQLLNASGKSFVDLTSVSRAINLLYGNVGSNLDDRDWAFILGAADPLSVGEQLLKAQWQDHGYLARNANHLLSNGGSEALPEITYREMSRRLDYDYDYKWSIGSRFEEISTLGDGVITSIVLSDRDPDAIFPRINLSFSDTGVTITEGLAVKLSFSELGSDRNISGGNYALSPGAFIGAGLISVTLETGVTLTRPEKIFVGTNVGTTQSFFDESTYNRIIILGNGDDEVLAGEGNDTVYGGNGADSLYGNGGDDVIYGNDGNDLIQAGKGNDSAYGGAGNDRIYGGTMGNDLLQGGSGADQFRVDINSGADVIADFSLTDGDLIALKKGGSGSSGVAFVAGGNSSLSPFDFSSVANIVDVRSDTDGAGLGNNQLYVITSGQDEVEIQSAVSTGALNAYALLYDTSRNMAVLYFDADWSDSAGRAEIAQVVGLASGDLATLTRFNFLAGVGY